MLGLSHNGVNNLRLCFENKFCHFFLPPTVNKWIQKRIQNSKRAGPLKVMADSFCPPIFEKNIETGVEITKGAKQRLHIQLSSALCYI